MNTYPSWRYHRTEQPVVVNNPDEEAALGAGWEHTPAAFSEPDESDAIARTRVFLDELSKPAELHRLQVPQLFWMNPYAADDVKRTIELPFSPEDVRSGKFSKAKAKKGK